MDNLNNVLDLFPSREMKDQLNDIIRVINDISNKRPIVGFHHSFYVPGWIGIIQTTIVESKMNKFASSTFYRNMNYYEFGDWIINKSRNSLSFKMERLLMTNKQNCHRMKLLYVFLKY